MFTSMVQKIVDRVQETPDQIALLNEDGVYNYGQLGGRCQGIIDSLRNAPSGVVLVYGHKQVDVVAAMLACTLLGRAFSFIDIANPLPRIIQILRTANARSIICAQPLPGTIDGFMVDTGSIASRRLSMPRYKTSNELFCIVFTSGSTGAPKGVQIGCDNFGHFYSWYGLILRGCRGTDAHVNHASLSFDMGMLDLWPSLAIGKPVILLDHRNNPLPRANLRLLTRSESIVPGSWFSTPTFLEIMCSEAAFNESALPRLRTFFVAGEAVQRSLIAKLIDRFPGAEIWHGYGPTEVTCLTHCLRLSSPDLIGSGPLPLGRVLSPTAIRIIGDTGREVAVGEYGEIELAGPQVAHGYLPKDLPGMSAFGSRDDVRFYRTGDYGVLDQEGSLKLSGRRDDQVKWKGNRIEIAEIEQVASDAPMARKTAVVPIRREGQVIDLILVVQLNHDNPDGRSAFRNHLARSLPPYMRPRSIRFVSSMPVTLHGKLDRTRLATELIDAPKGEP